MGWWMALLMTVSLWNSVEFLWMSLAKMLKKLQISLALRGIL
jgi:hypothetical protein